MMEMKLFTTTASVTIDGHCITMVFRQQDNEDVVREIKDILLMSCENSEGGVENDG